MKKSEKQIRLNNYCPYIEEKYYEIFYFVCFEDLSLLNKKDLSFSNTGEIFLSLAQKVRSDYIKINKFDIEEIIFVFVQMLLFIVFIPIMIFMEISPYISILILGLIMFICYSPIIICRILQPIYKNKFTISSMTLQNYLENSNYSVEEIILILKKYLA